MSENPNGSMGALIDVLPVAVLTTCRDHRIQWMNAAASRLLGIEAASAVGRPCEEVLDCSRCGERCGTDDARDTGETVRDFPATVHPAGGPGLLVRIDAVPIGGGEVAVVLGCAEPADPPLADERMREALRVAAGNVTRASRLLGVHRTTLWRWMGEAGLKREDFFPKSLSS
jgi:PAS domain-containing protein